MRRLWNKMKIMMKRCYENDDQGRAIMRPFVEAVNERC